MRIAVIPARGGSKRIPRKNIKLFHGKPMLAWSIEAARQSLCFDRIIVSTDDEEIAEIARHNGAEVPFMRPPLLSNDYAGTTPVIKHAIEELVSMGCQPDVVCCIYATAPFVKAEDIQKGLHELQKNKCDFAFSITSFAAPIQRAFKITSNQRIEMFYPENFSKRSQDLEPAYHDAAQFYWGTAAAWLDEKPLFAQGSVPVELPRYRVQDIDTPEDWERAELMFDALMANRRK